MLGIHPEFKVHKYENDEFLEIKVVPSKIPIAVRGRFYKRIGNTTREIDREGLKELLLKDVAWDSQLRNDIIFKNLAQPLAASVAISAAQKMYGAVPEIFDEREFFERLGLIQNTKITNAALLLFGRRDAPRFRFARIRIGRFKDESTILDDHI